MTLETWLNLNKSPAETRKEATERYLEEQGVYDPAEKQRVLDEVEDYTVVTPLEQQAGFTGDIYGDWTPPEPVYTPTEDEYVEDPDLWDSLMRGTDLAQASVYGFGEGPVAGFLDDIGLDDTSASLKDWAREGRLEQERQAAQIAPAKTVEQELQEDPDHWLYKHFDKDMMTAGQMLESAPTSLTPWAAAVPLALATPYLLSSAGIAATGTIGSKLIAAGVGMGAGNLASSAIVSSEAYERGKEEKVIRQQLGVDPNKKFEDLSNSDQQKVDRVATDLSQTSFGHRLYTAGLVEMASYIPYGHAVLRLALDAGLGTASEVWDRTLYSDDAVSALIENGVPVEKAEELRNAILEAGPSFRQVLISALQQEFVMGGAATGIESMLGAHAPQVNAPKTASKKLREEVAKGEEDIFNSKQAQINDERNRVRDQLKADIKAKEGQEKYQNSLELESFKSFLKSQDNIQKQEIKEKERADKDAEKLLLPYTPSYEGAIAQEGYSESLIDQVAYFEPYRSIAEAKQKDAMAEEARAKKIEEAKEWEARFDANLPISVAELNRYKKEFNTIVEERRAEIKQGTDLDLAIKRRQEAIDTKIRELTPDTPLRTAEEIQKERTKERAWLSKENRVLDNMKKRIYGVKGDEKVDRTLWPAERFLREKQYKERKLALDQRKELFDNPPVTDEQLQRRKNINEEAIRTQAEKIVNQEFMRSTVDTSGDFSLNKQQIETYLTGLGNRHERYKGLFTVLDKNSVEDLTNIILKARHKNKKGARKGKVLRENEATLLAEKLLKENNAWVYRDHIYINADAIKGENKTDAVTNLVKIATFHEPIAHLGLKQFLAEDYIPFLDNFFNTNKNFIKDWAENEVLTEQGEAAYLDGDFEDLSPSQQRDLAEEFLANKFVEMGILDPDIVSRTADALVSALKGVVDPLNKRVSITEARSVLAEVQRNYLGGKKNIITGDLFDPANWTMKGIEVSAGEDKVEAYRRYLKEQGIKAKSPTERSQYERAIPTGKEKIETVSGLGAIRRKSTLQKAVDATPEDELEQKREDQKSPTRFTQKRQSQSQLLRIKAEEKRIKKGQKKLDKELKEKYPAGTPGERPDVIFASKRIMTPREAGDVTFKFSKKTITPMQRKVYSLLKPTEKSLAYTKTAKNRPEEKQKRPTAKLQKFTLPKRANGKSPVVYVGGGKSTDNWKEQVESVLSKSQIKEAIQWYPRVKNAFIKEFGKDSAPNMMLAWALANKAESPLGAMKNVLRAKENLANTISPELRKKGGLNDEVITKILKDEEATKGSGVKLYDFVDAMLGMEARNWTGFDPAMGAPAVVDRHTWRDRGWTDNTLINYIKSQLPKNKRAKKLEADKPNPTVTPIEYEETASWLRNITNDLNNEKWMGRSNWTPDQTQAVGWMAVTELLQIPGGTSQSVLAETARSVAFEIAFGKGTPFESNYGEAWKKMSEPQRNEFTTEILDQVTDIALARTGVVERDRVAGKTYWGFWENEPMSPNMVLNVSATDQGMENIMNVIGYLAQQDAVYAFGPKHNAKGVGIDIYDKNGKFADEKILKKIYSKLVQASPWDKGGYIRGASQTIVNGQPALRIVLENTTAKGKKVSEVQANNKKLQKQRKAELKPYIIELVNDLDLDIIVDSFQAQVFKAENNWKDQPNGELYRQRISENFRPPISRRIQDSDAKAVESAIRKKFGEFGIKASKVTARKAKTDYEGSTDRRRQEDVRETDREVGESTALDQGRWSASFFSDVTKGKKGKSTTGRKFKFITPSILKESLKDSFRLLNRTYKKHIGNFDDHIAHSIPAYRDVQMNMANAILATYKNQDTNMLDIGASEGALPKSITELSKGKIKTVSLDVNLDMKARFDKTPVDGAEFSDTAFSNADVEGQPAWKEGDRQVMNYKPDRKFDIVQEAMVFQFIDNDRPNQIARVKNLLAKDGVAIIEEKVFLPADNYEGINRDPNYLKNEEYKDDNYKSKFFTKAEMEEKKKEILKTGDDQIEGMEKYMVPKNFLEDELLANFNHVEQFWDSGNFKGYIASDSKTKLDALSKNILDTNTEFSTAKTPIRIMASKRLASKKAIPPRQKWLQWVKGQQEGIEPVGRPETPEWNEFMEGSKIKYPLYHGSPWVIEKRYTDTQAEIEAKGGKYEEGGNLYSASFQYDKLEPGQFELTGLHLSSEPEYSNMYAAKFENTDETPSFFKKEIETEGPNVIKGFVNVKNPLKMEVRGDIKKWKEGVQYLRKWIQKGFDYKKDDIPYPLQELLITLDKNPKVKEKFIRRTDPEIIFSKEERKGIRLYTMDSVDLMPGRSLNREFLQYVGIQLSDFDLNQDSLDQALNAVLYGMGHDALLYVQEIGDAPRPFIGVMLLDPQFTYDITGDLTTDEHGMPKFPFRSAYNQKPNDPNDFKFSKRVKNYSPDELVAEWRANSLKADAAPPPRKKDKVTISPEARVKASDIAPKEIMNPDGNIKASKILASRAAHHAISTRDTGKKKPLRYRIAEKLTRRLVAQGTLPDAEKYKALRRVASGTIVKAEEAGRALYDALKKTKQPETIYRYFTERDFDAKNIKNKEERKIAVEAKAKIQNIGVELVGMGLMDEGARLQYEGQYLPQMYLKYMIPDEAVIKVRGGGIRIDAGYLKKRRDIPEGVKKLILGQIKDPAYLATRATTVPIKDMAIINWLQQIAANPNWVLPSTLVEFDMLGEMKKKALDLGIQKQLELKDTKGVKISAHWLANEARRMYNQTKFMNITKDELKIIQDVTAKMEKLAEEVNDNIKVDPSQYSIVPKTAKYGMLGGMAVRKEIANDIFGGMNMTTGDISMAESILGDGGVVGDYNRLWKWAKVSANPPSWVRNFVSNMILMNMGGVSWYKMPGLILSSLKDMKKMGKHKGALHQLTKDLGLTSGNFSNVELGRIEREFKDLQIRLNKKGAGPMGVLGMIKGAFNKVQDVTSDTYGGIDSLGKMMMVKNAMNEAKLKVKDLADYTPKERAKLDDIALNAEKWLFDYSNPLPSVKWLRRAPFGAPFISFTSFVAPLMLETAITKPWKFLPYYVLGYAAKEWFKEAQDLDDEQYEGLKVSMSEYLREKAYTSVFPTGVVPWPYLDENGRVQFQDISYLFPWGMFSEMGGEIAEGKYFDAMKTAGLMGGPTLNVASAVLTGIDPFTRQPIVDPTGNASEQAADVMWYVFNLTMPPMFHGIGQGPNQGYGAVKRLIEAHTGQLTKEGEARFTKTQAWLRMFGQNVTPIAVPEGRNKQLRYEYSQLMRLERLAKRDLKNSIIMQESDKEIKEKIEAYRDKIIKARKELINKVKISSPPISLLRQREQALRKMRQRLQQQKAS